MKVNIETIPHNEHRYETVGDYWTDENGVLQIRVSEMGNDKYNTLVAIHEFIEAKLTEWNGIKEQDITDFDIEFEKQREEGNTDEPGFNSIAPYRREHTLATGVELIIASLANVDWNDYEKNINSL